MTTPTAAIGVAKHAATAVAAATARPLITPTLVRRMQIERASYRHLDTLAPLFDQYRTFYKQHKDIPAARAFLKERMDLKQSVIFIASELPGHPTEDGARIARALGFTQLYPSFSSVDMKRLWILNDLYVIPQARKSGVGRALMEAARQHAIRTKAKGLQLQTAVDNLDAQRAYEKFGWVKDTEFFTYELNV